MRTILRSAAFGATLAGLLIGPAAHAQSADTPVGLWKTIDDETKQAKALVRIVEQGGQLIGRIERIFAADKATAVCEACTDDRKGKPVQGMTILVGLKKDGEEWTGGEILDPNNGKVYKAKARLVDAGRKLDLRGYIGVPMMGRTQTWIREQ
ncbi:MAG: hypothetical protein RJA99_1754 [Pseudomonadota bacterium]|jgi:uncharacterized protein (DUF2147 family)